MLPVVRNKTGKNTQTSRLSQCEKGRGGGEMGGSQLLMCVDGWVGDVAV